MLRAPRKSGPRAVVTGLHRVRNGRSVGAWSVPNPVGCSKSVSGTPALEQHGFCGFEMSLTAIGFWLLYISGVGAALLTPLAGVLLYILVYHLNPEYQWWGESVRATGLRTSMTVIVAIAIGLALRWPRF